MATLKQINGEEKAGRAAADRLSKSWGENDWIPTEPSEDWARGAIERLGEIINEQPAIVRASLKGAERGASTLSPRPFQGILECLQNADDLGATRLSVAYRESPRRELLIVHNGSPVTLANVGAMLLPWLSTKDDDPDASGRFGIGQKTLKSLGDPIALHAPPFHFVMHADGPEVCPAEAHIKRVYDPASRDTMLRLPLNSEVEVEQIGNAIDELNANSLVFLRTVRRLEFFDLTEKHRNISYEVDVRREGAKKISFAEGDCTVEVSSVRPMRSGGVGPPPLLRRYLIYRPTPAAQFRANKAKGATTPIGLCVRLAGVASSSLYDRMPLPISVQFPISLNAQFDPDSARSTLTRTRWNEARLDDLGDLVTWAALDAFRDDPSIAWQHVPLRDEAGQHGGWVSDQISKRVIDPCHKRLKEELIIHTPAGQIPVHKLAYEADYLEDLLSDGDLETLFPNHVAVPRAARDDGGRWRAVLSELGRSKLVTIIEALNLLDEDLDREPEWFVRFALLAMETDFLDEFLERPSLLLADGRVVSCPQRGERRILARNAAADALPVRLGLVQCLHPAYFDERHHTAELLKYLKHENALIENGNEATIALEILGRGGAFGDTDDGPVRLTDNDLIELRDAWSQLVDDKRTRLGARIGNSVALRAVQYDEDGRSHHIWASPTDAYLPAAIDRETESFAKAAGRTPGLIWIDKSYAKLLKQSGGRGHIGAQRLLSAWGVARDPRLIKPTNLRTYYVSDPRQTSPIWGVSRPEAQIAHLSSQYSDLIGDHWSPDLDAVVENILDGPAKSRRKRAMALLAVLSRGWERRYADYQVAKAAYPYYGWVTGPDVKATWLARLGDEPWLPDASGGLRIASELQLPLPGVSTAPKDRPRTLAKVDEQILRSGILPSLGVKSGPTPADLVKQLQGLKAQQVTKDVIREAELVYQLLSASLHKDDPFPGEAMTPAQLRNAFRAGRDGRGLLLAQGEWRSPEAVFQGPMIFGDRRPFAPLVLGLEPLWKALNIPFPKAADAVAVLRDLGQSIPTDADQGVMVATLRFLASKIDGMTPQLRGTLKRLPLWDGKAWRSERPIYALEGESLVENAPPSVGVWRPGITSFIGLEGLLDALGVTKLGLADFRPVSMTAYGFAEGDEIRQTFATATQLLKQELLRADQALLDGLTVDWNELQGAYVSVDPDLAIEADGVGGAKIRMPIRAHMCREPLGLIVRSLEDAGTSEGGGLAVASLFSGDRQKIAWAWAAVWPRASAGERAQPIVLPKTKADKASASGRLSDLKQQSETRQGRKTKPGSPASEKQQGSIQVRKLRDLDQLEPTSGSIVNSGSRLEGTVFNQRKSSESGQRTFSKPGNGGAGPSSETATRSVLPPTNDRETLALEAVRRALRLDAKEIVDLRSRRGVGVDAVDELRQCYEIKMSSSATIPSDVTLTASEVEAARSDPDFFLAVVSGLEDGAGTLRVRFIFDPLRCLAMKIKGDLTLTGVDKVEALEYEFKSADCAAAG